MTIIQKTIDYFRSAKAEMFKVSWPSRRDTIRYSSLVIGISILVAVFFASLDYGFTKLFDVTVLSYAQHHLQAQVKNAQSIPITPVNPSNPATPPAQPVQPAQPTQPSTIDLQKAKPIETPKK